MKMMRNMTFWLDSVLMENATYSMAVRSSSYRLNSKLAKDQ